ncbi:helix-hairpin-helix domain-containing protein [Listeria costaricensis]|uniref:helix-hairpin-helix domain-containing protein n=1 Tax=Listeria costaricensis TaxID=2026604 RepID=UPI000C06FCC9|nr:helix-hairpin-helix domain-containing protein [Listeria costaricensis]
MFEKIKPHWKYGLAALAVLLLVIGYTLMTKQEELSQPAASASSIETAEETNKTVEADKKNTETPSRYYIDVKGAVQKPGVYQVPKDGRIQDVIQMAGGFSEEADVTAINLAAKLQDEMLLIVPKIGEVSASTPSAGVTQQAETDSDKVDLNSATAADLQEVPGIGEAKATAIITYREEEGLFQSVDDLTNVSGIGEKTVEKLAEYVFVSEY